MTDQSEQHAKRKRKKTSLPYSFESLSFPI